jgi:hypothetical protein
MKKLNRQKKSTKINLKKLNRQRKKHKNKLSKQNTPPSNINLFKSSDLFTRRKKFRTYTSKNKLNEYKFTSWYNLEKKIYKKLERNTAKPPSEKFIRESLTGGKNMLERSEKEMKKSKEKEYLDLTENKSQFEEKTKPINKKNSDKSMNIKTSHQPTRDKLKKKQNKSHIQIRKRNSYKTKIFSRQKSIDSEESLEKLNSRNLGFSLWKDEKAYENWLKTYGLDDASLALDYSTKSLDPKGMELIQKETHIYSRSKKVSSICNSSGEPVSV